MQGTGDTLSNQMFTFTTNFFCLTTISLTGVKSEDGPDTLRNGLPSFHTLLIATGWLEWSSLLSTTSQECWHHLGACHNCSLRSQPRIRSHILTIPPGEFEIHVKIREAAILHNDSQGFEAPEARGGLGEAHVPWLHPRL